MKRVALLIVALVLVSGGIMGMKVGAHTEKAISEKAIGEKTMNEKTKLVSSHDLALLKEKGIILESPKIEPVVSKEEAIALAEAALGSISKSQEPAVAEYWDVRHTSHATQVSKPMPSWIVTFRGLAMPDGGSASKTELNIFVDAINGQVLYMMSYR